LNSSARRSDLYFTLVTRLARQESSKRSLRSTISRAIYDYRVLYRDAEPVVICLKKGNLLVVDMERAESHSSHQPLGPIDVNSRSQRKKRGLEPERDEFVRKLEQST
jgi:hypothetical protein